MIILSSLISFAEVAKDYNYVRPVLTTENVIYIENGRHPLQELCVRGPFIPNNTAIAYGIAFCCEDFKEVVFFSIVIYSLFIIYSVLLL
jgi:hypothetical protein